MSKYETTLVAVVNESSLPDSEVAGWVPAFQKYISYHLRRAWGVAGHVVFYPKGATIGTSYGFTLPLRIQDRSNVQGAFGYHTIDNNGQPEGFVFQETCKEYGASVTVCATHEIAEALCDILCSFSGGPDANNYIYALEVGDPVENDSDGFFIDNILCSDFIHPSWFVDDDPGPLFDEMGKINKPFEVLTGGYVSIWTGSGWQQKQMRSDGLVDTKGDSDDFGRMGARR